MKKIFTFIATAIIAVSANAQTISLAGLQTSDFSYDESAFEPSTWTNNETSATCPAFNYKGTNKQELLTLVDKGIAFQYKNSGTKENFFILGDEFFTVGGKGASLEINNAKKGQTITLTVAAKADNSGDSDSNYPGFTASGATLNGEAPRLSAKYEFADISFTVTADGNVSIKENNKGYCIKTVTISDGEFVLPDGTYFIQYPGNDANKFTDENGFQLQITGNLEKNYGKGKEVTIDGKNYQAIKCSNGAENTLTLPEGKVATGITLYSYVNAASNGEKEPGLWKEVGGFEYNETTTEVFTHFNDDLTNLDERTFSFGDGKLNTITFTNKNQQVCFIIKISIESGTPVQPSGISTVKAETSNGTIYNLKGQRVDAQYKGIVIKNGKKVFNT